MVFPRSGVTDTPPAPRLLSAPTSYVAPRTRRPAITQRFVTLKLGPNSCDSCLNLAALWSVLLHRPGARVWAPGGLPSRCLKRYVVVEIFHAAARTYRGSGTGFALTAAATTAGAATAASRLKSTPAATAGYRASASHWQRSRWCIDPRHLAPATFWFGYDLPHKPESPCAGTRRQFQPDG